MDLAIPYGTVHELSLPYKEKSKMMNKKEPISRRDFIKNSMVGAVVLASTSAIKLPAVFVDFRGAENFGQFEAVSH
jgi:hypothetical protein